MACDPADDLTGRILERIGQASDFEEAASAVLDSLFTATPRGAAVLLAKSGDDVRSAGWKEGQDVLGRAEGLAMDEGSFIASHFGSRGPVVENPPPQIGAFAVELALPLNGKSVNARGLLLASGTDRDPHRLEAILSRCAQPLLRIFELDLLREERDRLSSRKSLHDRMLDAISDPVLVTDSDANIVTANARAGELFFSSPDDPDGRIRAIRLNAFLFSARLTEASIPGRRDGSRDLNLVDPTDGSDLLFELVTSRLEGATGRESLQISILRDITDLKRATEQLEIEFRRSRVAEHHARRESERLQTIIGSVAQPILVTDAESNIVLMNTEAERLFEVGEGEKSAGERDADRSRWTNVTRITSFVNDVMLSRAPRRQGQVTLLRPEGGRTIPVEATGTRIEDEQGQLVSIVTVLRDLTPLVENEKLASELRQLNEQLEARIADATRELEERNRTLRWQRKELEKASRLKSQFLASMSHELRTPINAILGYTALVDEEIYGPLTDGQARILGKVERASEHLLELINDILDLSKIEAGKMPLRLEEVRLEDLAAEVRTTIDPILTRRPLECRFEIDRGLAPLVTDRTKLRQVLLNLLENGIKYTSEGWIALRARSDPSGEGVVLEIEDSGAGIADEDLAHIFEAFRQGTPGPDQSREGAGLGLSISRRLVELMGGSIAVASEVGTGTCFTVRLPRRTSPSATVGAEDHGAGYAPAPSRDEGEESPSPGPVPLREPADPGAGKRTGVTEP